MKRAQLLKIKAQMSSIWAKGCVLMIVFVLSEDMTTPPWWREKVMVYYYDGWRINTMKLMVLNHQGPHPQRPPKGALWQRL